MKMSELKPCPFCGGSAEFIGSPPKNGYDRVACKMCDTEHSGDDEASSILGWNTRTDTVWQDISTAPKDENKDVLVGWHSDHWGKFIWARAGQVRGAWYLSGGTGTACYPTHWHPLQPPEGNK
jgi:hypothetical protein